MPPEVRSGKPPRSRTLVLLVSCGLWLLYFDLLTSMPGCTSDSKTGAGAQIDASAQELTDAPTAGADANGNVAFADSAEPAPDAPSGDAPSADAPADSPIDGGAIADADPLDAAIVDAPLVDAAILDAMVLVDADLIDASVIDAM